LAKALRSAAAESEALFHLSNPFIFSYPKLTLHIHKSAAAFHYHNIYVTDKNHPRKGNHSLVLIANLQTTIYHIIHSFSKVKNYDPLQTR